MKVRIEGNTCIVTREEGDPKFYGTTGGKGESRLLYHVKHELEKQGYDLVKKRMWKDGHMVDELQQYLRTRKKGAGKGDIYVYNGNWMIRGAEEDYNERGEVRLVVMHDVFDVDER